MSEEINEMQVINSQTEEWDDILGDFLAEAHRQEHKVLVRLYRVHPREKMKKRKDDSILYEWEDEKPEFMDIASEYGPGTYRLRAIVRGRNKTRLNKQVTFTIDPDCGIFNSEDSPVQVQHNTINNDTAMYQFMMQQQATMFKSFMDTMAEMFKATNNRNNNDSWSDIGKAMSDVVTQNFQVQNALVDRVVAARIPADETEEEEQQPMDLFSIVKTVWQKYGHVILNAQPEVQQVYASEVKKQPVYQAIESNPEGFKNAYEQLISEGVDQNDVNRVLNVLEIPIPDMG